MRHQTILIADDDSGVLASLDFLLTEEGFVTLQASTPAEVFHLLAKHSVDLLLSDMNFKLDTTSGREGLDLLEKVARQEPEMPIIVMTGWATVDVAVQALKSGARDLIQKPWKDELLLTTINNELNSAQLEKKTRRLTEQNRLLTGQNHPQRPESIIAESSAMKSLLKSLEELAQSDMNLLLTGDNGTGKSMLAQFIHNASKRRENPFVSVNMGAISESLFESEMFGHVKGAFTDARESRIGRFEMAESGSLFLDELANIPLSQQAKLLRVLEERHFEPVGSSKTQACDLRIVSATNANLTDMIAQKQFRQDLYYRLNTIELRVPSLAERCDDIIPLAEHFLALYSQKYHRPKPTLSTSAASHLQDYDWPGNIRELSHLMERSLFTGRGKTIEPEDLNLKITGRSTAKSTSTSDRDLTEYSTMTLEAIEKSVLINRLQQHAGNVTKTARSLGLSRSGYYRRIQKYELD